MVIGIIGAMLEEVNDIITSCELIKTREIAKNKFYELKYKEHIIIIVKSGVGKVNAAIATTILAMEFKVDLIISTGIAGGMSPLKTGDVCLVDKLFYGDVDATAFGYKLGEVPGEKYYYQTDNNLLNKVKLVINKYNWHVSHTLTSDKFVTSMPHLPENKTFCFEMESAAIAHVADHFSIPILVIRYISDLVGQESQIEDYSKFEDEIAKRSCKITLEILGSL